MDVVDIGETSYSMPLVDDINGDGRMDLVVATMSRVVYAFESGDALRSHARVDLAGARREQLRGASGDVRRAGEGQRIPRRSWHEDRRAVRNRRRSSARRGRDERSTRTVRRAGGSHRARIRSIGQGTFEEPGDYALSTEIPNWRARGRVTVRVSDGSKIFVEDVYSVSFHMRMYRALKWILVVPFTLRPRR